MDAEDGEGWTGLAIMCSDPGVTPAVGHGSGLLSGGQTRGLLWGQWRSASVAPAMSHEKTQGWWEGGAVILTSASFFHI